MAQLPADKYNIAWFKLAEFVVRGEKERALGMYRLLSHSLPDGAFAAQLEGDLLLAFHDERAIDAYVRAAIIYEKGSRLAQAAAVYENLLGIQPKMLEYQAKVVELYARLGNDSKLEYWLHEFFCLSLEQCKGDYAHHVLDTLPLPQRQQTKFHDYLMMKWLTTDYTHQEAIKELLRHTLEGYLEHHNTDELAHFMARLEAADASLAIYAKSLLESI